MLELNITVSLTPNEPSEENVKKESHKARSLIAFPENYVVVDLETTGISADYDDIIEFGAVKVIDNEIVDELSVLCNPGYEIDEYIEALTGITNEMLADAPSAEYGFGKLSEFIGDLPMVTYTRFDSLFLRIQFDFEHPYVDLFRLFKRITPEMKHHRLRDMCEFYSIENETAHRAVSDCKATHNCFVALKNNAIEKYGSLEGFASLWKPKHYSIKDIQSNAIEIDTANPFYGKVCVFTGALERMTRAEAAQLVANLGGICADGVTKKTNFLILGNNDYCPTIKDGKSSKHKKAEKLKLEGHDIEIMPESLFYELIEN